MFVDWVFRFLGKHVIPKLDGKWGEIPNCLEFNRDIDAVITTKIDQLNQPVSRRIVDISVGQDSLQKFLHCLLSVESENLRRGSFVVQSFVRNVLVLRSLLK